MGSVVDWAPFWRVLADLAVAWIFLTLILLAALTAKPPARRWPD